MALQLDVECRGVSIKDAYIKITNLTIDNTGKTLSCWLSMSTEPLSKPLPLDIQSSFSGIPVQKGVDPLQTAYEFIMKTESYIQSRRV